MKKSTVIPPEIYSNEAALISAFSSADFEKNMIDNYFQTFIDSFPGIIIIIIIRGCKHV